LRQSNSHYSIRPASKQRRINVLKLSGFPEGTTAYDLKEILQPCKAKTCFIPFNLNTSRNANYAFITFKSDELLGAAQETLYSFQGKELYWVNTDQKTCHICGNPGHLANSCPIKMKRFEKSDKDIKIQRLYNRYRPANHRKPQRSYADVAQSSRNN